MKTGRMIYLDNNATTQALPEVVDAMGLYWGERYANPSSVHAFGQMVRHGVETARGQVAELIGALPKEIVFTSGGTESINLAIRGCLAMRPGKRRLVTTAVEHSAVLRVAEQLRVEGYEVETVGVDREGRLDEEEWREKLTPETGMASIMHANNETGVLFDVSRIAGIAAERGIPVHVDAVQSIGKMPVRVTDWPASFVSLAGHKFHGPKGVGALYIRRRAHVAPQILGGSQERMLRGGTENVAGIIGMGVAAEVARRDGAEKVEGVRALRDPLEAGIKRAVPSAHVNGSGAERMGNTSNVSFEGLEAEAILILLSEAGICASSGAACSSGSLEPSHVLRAMHVDERMAHGAIRFSLSLFNTEEEIDEVVATMPKLLSKLTVLAAN